MVTKHPTLTKDSRSLLLQPIRLRILHRIYKMLCVMSVVETSLVFIRGAVALPLWMGAPLVSASTRLQSSLLEH